MKRLSIQSSPTMMFLRPVAMLIASALCLTSYASADSASWTRFGGPTGDFHQQADLGAWPEAGPTELWRLPIGPGYGGVVGDASTIYVPFLEAEKAGEEEKHFDVLAAVDAKTGEVRWRQRFSNETREANRIQFGRGPNASPLLLDDRIVNLGFNGELRAHDLESGKVLWERDLVADFDAEIRSWGFSASPIFHDGRVLVAIGGEKHGLIAVNPADGELIWGGPATSASYATPIVVRVGDRDQAIYYGADALFSLDASSGEELWRMEIVNKWANHSTMPIAASGDLLWVISQLKSGARVLRLSDGEKGAQIETVWQKEKIQVHYWNTLLVDDVVYAAIGNSSDALSAIDLGTGKILWQENGYTQLNLVHLGDETLALDADGVLYRMKLSREGVQVISRHELFESATWTAPAVIGGRLAVRDEETLRVYSLKDEESAKISAH